MRDPDENFDINFDFARDTPTGADPDERSDTLRRYHQLLWSKPMESGNRFQLDAPAARRHGYLIHTASDGTRLWFGSDAITNSYTGWTRPKALVQALAELTEEQRARYLTPPYTIGSAMIWPVRTADPLTINRARGMNWSSIADRMDLTLECIRRHYAGSDVSPLTNTLNAYSDFFELFKGFDEFVKFFHFQDLTTDDCASVQYFLPFEDFSRPATPTSVEEYVAYQEASSTFVDRRQRRMAAWVAAQRN